MNPKDMTTTELLDTACAETEDGPVRAELMTELIVRTTGDRD